MNAKKTLLLLPLLILGAVALFGVSCVVGVHGRGADLWIDVPPPALQTEVAIASPGPDYAWIGGYWDWDVGVHHYNWVAGRWDRPPRRGAIWVAPRWEHGRRGWHRVDGHWR